jgi:hypothetical protein
MSLFSELALSRRHWIDTVLIPWCKAAPRKELLLAEREWIDIAGRPSPEATLWLWAWSRFPVLYDPQLPSINETRAVTVYCLNGNRASGYPDARRSHSGQLHLVDENGKTHGPFSIDEIVRVELVEDGAGPLNRSNGAE